MNNAPNFALLAKSFKEKLLTLDVDTITNDLLVKKYLQSIILQQDYYLKIYCWVLENAVSKCNKPIHEISFLDFGCGNGLFAIFAKYCGFKKVYGCDFNEHFVAAAKLLANQMHIEVTDWFVCNESDLYKKCNNLHLDIVAGTDVIEHIYNLNIFFSNIYLLNTKMVTAFTTASIYDNFFKRKSLYKLMHQDEYISSNALEATTKDEYAGLAYIETRKKIISRHFPLLQQPTISKLAAATRGLREDDIIFFANNYLVEKNIKPSTQNKHNTCDPITGNFTERMLTLQEYNLLYTNNHFTLTVKSGFYNAQGSGIKSFTQKCLNKIIFLLNNSFLSRTIAPLILLLGEAEKKRIK